MASKNYTNNEISNDTYGSFGHIKGALLADYNGTSFREDALKVLDKGKKVAIYCRSGRRSAAAAEILSKEGFSLYNLETGILGWTKEGKKLVK